MKGSAAETYAIKLKIPYEYIAEPTVTPTATPIPTPTEKEAQTITAKDITKTYSSKAFELGAKTDGNGKLTYKSSNKKVATVSSNGKITIKGCGEVTITINASETKESKSAQKKITLTVKPKQQKISSVKSSK